MRFIKFARGGVQKLALTVAITLSACLMVDIAPVQAAATITEGYYFLQDVQTDNGAFNVAYNSTVSTEYNDIFAAVNEASTTQVWHIVSAGSGYYQIISLSSGRAIADTSDWDGNGRRAVNKTASSSDSYQLWEFDEESSGQYVVKNKATARILDCVNFHDVSEGKALLTYNIRDGYNDQLFSLIAVPSYSITYTLNGGTDPGNPTSYNIASGAITLTAPTRTGYTFAGWTGSNGSTAQTSVTITAGSTGAKSYTAQWTANTYTLTYEGMGGTPSKPSQTGKYNSAWGTLATATRTGYTFGGWYSKFTLVGDFFTYRGAITSSTICTGNAPAFAKWTANKYYLAFNANGGSGTMANQTFRYGFAQTISANTFMRSNCIFTGWNTKADGTGTAYSDKQSVSNLSATNGATITLYAQWAHYVFNGWNTSADGSGTTYQPGNALPNSNLDLYAQWKYEALKS